MRTIDENKKNAIYQATIKLINEVGFKSASVSKIAKEANVSPATLYVYHENKEELLCALYLDLKSQMRNASISQVEEFDTTKDKLHSVWREAFNFIDSHPDYFQFIEAFGNSTYVDLVNMEELIKIIKPFFTLLEEGKKKGDIKEIHNDVLGIFAFHPIWILCNPRKCQIHEGMTPNRDLIFEMAWDAIKK